MLCIPIFALLVFLSSPTERQDAPIAVHHAYLIPSDGSAGMRGNYGPVLTEVRDDWVLRWQDFDYPYDLDQPWGAATIGNPNGIVSPPPPVGKVFRGTVRRYPDPGSTTVHRMTVTVEPTTTPGGSPGVPVLIKVYK